MISTAISRSVRVTNRSHYLSCYNCCRCRCRRCCWLALHPGRLRPNCASSRSKLPTGSGADSKRGAFLVVALFSLAVCRFGAKRTRKQQRTVEAETTHVPKHPGDGQHTVSSLESSSFDCSIGCVHPKRRSSGLGRCLPKLAMDHFGSWDVGRAVASDD